MISGSFEISKQKRAHGTNFAAGTQIIDFERKVT
jgi:hypothetical protein